MTKEGEKRREDNMEEIYSLYIGYAPDCTTATCPPGTGQ